MLSEIGGGRGSGRGRDDHEGDGTVRIRTTAARRFLAEAGLVGVAIFVLEFLTLWGFFTGFESPRFDFLGSYNTEFFAWWWDGSFFRPQEWTPYLWGGYPAAISLQNSSYYLPVGLVANLTFYDIHAAAALQAVHVAFGALGCYVLARSWGVHRVAALLGLTAYFFAAGFFANAQHVDIVRGYAFAPWLLFILSPAWPWRRWWAVPAAAFVLWQALVGIYPGMVVSTVYVGLVWVVANQLARRPRATAYLLPLGLAAVSAALLSMPKFLPAVAVRGAGSPTGVEVSEFDLGILATIFFPYGGDNLTYEMSMRSFFVPVTVLALVGLTPWRRAEARCLGLVIALAVFFALPTWPWFDAVAALPGMGLSRFRMSDFRMYILLALVLLAVLAADAATRRAGERDPAWGRRSHTRWGAPLYLAVLLVTALALGTTQDFTRALWAPTVSLLLCAAFAVLLVAGSWPRPALLLSRDRQLIAGTLVLLTVASGVYWAYSTTRPWLAPRESEEIATWGAPVRSLLATRFDERSADLQASREHVQRPARTPLVQDPVPPIEEQKAYNAAFYTGIATVGGYTNLKGGEGFEAMRAAFADPATSRDARYFFAAPGLGLQAPRTGPPEPGAVDACWRTTRCGDGLSVLPRHYAPGRFTYQLAANEPATVDFNEAYYDGWSARVCPLAGGAACVAAPTSRGDVGNLRVEVPSGQYLLELRYVTPRLRESWLLFWAGVGLASVSGVAVALAGLLHRKGDREGRRPPGVIRSKTRSG